jgi:hypothetical protein
MDPLEYAEGQPEREQDDETRPQPREGTWEDAGGGGDRVFPEFPPGRNDPRWGLVAKYRPDLLPAIDQETELEVRSVVDGMAHAPHARLDLCRLGGNGVVPQQAAIAVRSLLRQLNVQEEE